MGSRILMVLAAAALVACGGDGSGSVSTTPTGWEQPPANDDQPPGNPQSPPGNSEQPPGDSEDPGSEPGGGGNPPPGGGGGGGTPTQKCVRFCERAVEAQCDAVSQVTTCESFCDLSALGECGRFYDQALTCYLDLPDPCVAFGESTPPPTLPASCDNIESAIEDLEDCIDAGGEPTPTPGGDECTTAGDGCANCATTCDQCLCVLEDQVACESICQ